MLLFGVPAIAFLVVEGGSSLLLLVRDGVAAFQGAAPQTIHTEFDPNLGWVSKKRFVAPDMYGPGIQLSTNARGLRGTADVADSVPAGRKRVVCSGDSFTLGHGVSDGDTWCVRLARSDLETVNMGQAGYGIDQAYLWYKRDGMALEHHLHLLAFVTDDFRRMALDRFLGYAKPVLQVNGDSLMALGTPLQQQGGRVSTRLRRAVQGLRSAEFVARLIDRPAADVDRREQRLTQQEIRNVMTHIVADLQRINTQKQSRFALVYLPIERDFVNDAARPWREAMRTIADSLGVPIIDLVPALRARTQTDVQAMYFQQATDPGAEGMGHFTPEGNRWAAEQLHAQIAALSLLTPTQNANSR